MYQNLQILNIFIRILTEQQDDILERFPEIGNSFFLLRKTMKNSVLFNNTELWEKYVEFRRHIRTEIATVVDSLVAATERAGQAVNMNDILYEARLQIWHNLEVQKITKKKVVSVDGADESSLREMPDIFYPKGWLAYLKFGSLGGGSTAYVPAGEVDLVTNVGVKRVSLNREGSTLTNPPPAKRARPGPPVPLVTSSLASAVSASSSAVIDESAFEYHLQKVPSFIYLLK